MPSAKVLRVLRAFGLSASILLLAGACQQFFTFSLAKSLSRPPVTLTSITADQAAALVAAKPDQALAASALGALASLVTANPSSASIVSDAAQVAVIATGLDAALTQSLATVLTSGGTLSSTDIATISALLTTSASNVNANTTSIFSALAAQAASNPSALAASGTSAQTLVVAATAIALSDVLSQGLSIANVINGTSTYTPSASVSTTLSNLASGVTAIDPGNALLSTLQSSFNITF
ncbi:MAG TPA: hypothetical protein VMV44_15120 [Rectinemataceae bacterium]|nr:hypothetical protein [Rectinemataceae bacterium]